MNKWRLKYIANIMQTTQQSSVFILQIPYENYIILLILIFI